MAFLQAPMEVPLYIHLPQGYTGNNYMRKTHVLKLLQNIYGQKQSPQVWNKYLKDGLVKAGFSVSEVNPCLFYHSSVLILVYIDDCLLFNPEDEAIDEALKDLHNLIKTGGKWFTIEDQGQVNNFLGIKVCH